jgi:hypothetical protein
MKSFRPKSLSSDEDPRNGLGEPPASGGGQNREADFHGRKRSNETHASTTIRKLGSIGMDLARRRNSASWAMR